MAAGIVPFLHVNLLASMSIATGTQRVNLACQITMVFSMIVCQMIAWSSGWNAFIGAGPFVAACIVGLLAPRWMRL
jgi:TctA family transporter